MASSIQRSRDTVKNKVRFFFFSSFSHFGIFLPFPAFYVALTENRLFSRQLSDSFLSAFSHQPKKSWFIPEWTFWTWKFYKCFLKIGGNFSFWKMLNFLSFFVLLYVSGHFKQKTLNFFSQPTDKKILHINKVNWWFLTMSQK